MIEEILPTLDYYEVLTYDGLEHSIRTTDNKNIPIAIDNRDYQTFLKVDTDAKLCKRTELRTDAVKWAEIRAARDRLLYECDWAILPDSPLDMVDVDKLKVYRQELRDIPSKFKNPIDVIFPENPLK